MGCGIADFGLKCPKLKNFVPRGFDLRRHMGPRLAVAWTLTRGAIDRVKVLWCRVKHFPYSKCFGVSEGCLGSVQDLLWSVWKCLLMSFGVSIPDNTRLIRNRLPIPETKVFSNTRFRSVPKLKTPVGQDPTGRPVGPCPLDPPKHLLYGKCLMVTWQLRVILDRISNSCDVYEKGWWISIHGKIVKLTYWF